VPFLERSLHRVKNHLTSGYAEGCRCNSEFAFVTTMHELNRKKLNHPKLVQIFDRYATYNGSNPFQAPGILHVIPHLEHGFGTFFPVGGMRSIVTSLVRLAEDCGVTFECPVVDKIEVNQNRAKGLVMNGFYLQMLWSVTRMYIRPTHIYWVNFLNLSAFLLRSVRAVH
jgi:diapolycopene oxygenase